MSETYHCAHCLLFFQLAEQLYQTMSKRFSQSKKVWVGFGAFYMRQGKLDVGRKLLQRSLKSLPKRKREWSFIGVFELDKSRKYCGLMVSTLDSGLSDLGSSSAKAYFVVLLGKTHYSYIASPRRCINWYRGVVYAGVNVQ